MTGYRVKDWSEFQHYKDRNPPWIRLHKRLLDNRKFHSLPDDSRALAPMLWLLASESEDIGSGLIALSDDDIAFRLRRTTQEFRKAMKPLLVNGFFESFQDASGAIAEREQLAVPETETEAETESPPDSHAPTKIPYHDIPADWLGEAMAERGWPQNVVEDIWTNFRDYWTTGKGRTTKRTDWRATWRNWYRKENIKTGGQQHATHQQHNPKRGGDPASNAFHAAQSIIARRNAAAGISAGTEPAHHAPAADLRLPEDLRRQGGDDGIPGWDVSGDPR